MQKNLSQCKRTSSVLRFVFGVLVVGSGCYVAATYPRFRAEMRTAKVRLLADSQILQTKAGPIEYADPAQARPFSLRMGQAAAMTKVSLSAICLWGIAFA